MDGIIRDGESSEEVESVRMVVVDLGCHCLE